LPFPTDLRQEDVAAVAGYLVVGEFHLAVSLQLSAFSSELTAES
jgi:hypothetical protein